MKSLNSELMFTLTNLFSTLPPLACKIDFCWKKPVINSQCRLGQILLHFGIKIPIENDHSGQKNEAHDSPRRRSYFAFSAKWNSAHCRPPSSLKQESRFKCHQLWADKNLSIEVEQRKNLEKRSDFLLSSSEKIKFFLSNESAECLMGTFCIPYLL